MSALQPPEICKWCGENVPAKAERCPLCGRPVSAGPSLSPHEEPREVAPGQEPFGSWSHITQTIMADKAFGVVLGLLAVDVLLSFLSRQLFSVLVSVAVFWGVLTFQWWGLWFALCGSGLGALLSLSPFLSGMKHGGTTALVSAIPLAINLFVAGVLYSRREHFD